MKSEKTQNQYVLRIKHILCLSIYNTQFLKQCLIKGGEILRLMQLIFDVVCSFPPLKGAVYKVKVHLALEIPMMNN